MWPPASQLETVENHLLFPASLIRRERLQNAAIGDSTVCFARRADSAKFVGKALEVGNLLLDIIKVSRCDSVDLGAFLFLVGRDVEQIADLADCEAKVPAASNEAQSTRVGPGVDSVIAAGARRFGKKTFLFVIANRHDLYPRNFRKFANAQS
jgi:hypothetical protein